MGCFLPQRCLQQHSGLLPWFLQVPKTKETSPNISRRAATTQGDGSLHFHFERLEHLYDALRAIERKAPKYGPYDSYSSGANRERFDNVSASTDSSVHKNRDFAANLINDRRQQLNRRRYRIELTPTMIGNNETVHTTLDCDPSVVRMRDALQQYLQLSVLAQPLDLLPGQLG